MRKMVFPLLVFAVGLLVANYFLGIDVEKLFKGFGNFVADILKGGNK